MMDKGEREEDGGNVIYERFENFQSSRATLTLGSASKIGNPGD